MDLDFDYVEICIDCFTTCSYMLFSYMIEELISSDFPPLCKMKGSQYNLDVAFNKQSYITSIQRFNPKIRDFYLKASDVH